MITLEAFADGIMQFEGWRPGSRSWRNRNPGNLRWSTMQTGTDGGYAAFDSLDDGWQAMIHDIKCKCRGKPFTSTGLGPDSTILEFFQKWAPSSDGNHPVKYAEFVAQCLTKATTKPFTPQSLLKEIYPG